MREWRSAIAQAQLPGPETKWPSPCMVSPSMIPPWRVDFPSPPLCLSQRHVGGSRDAGQWSRECYCKPWALYLPHNPCQEALNPSFGFMVPVDNADPPSEPCRVSQTPLSDNVPKFCAMWPAASVARARPRKCHSQWKWMTPLHSAGRGHAIVQHGGSRGHPVGRDQRSDLAPSRGPGDNVCRRHWITVRQCQVVAPFGKRPSSLPGGHRWQTRQCWWKGRCLRTQQSCRLREGGRVADRPGCMGKRQP